MFCQVVIYKYGPWSVPGDKKYKWLKDVLSQRPYCWDSGIVKLANDGGSGVLLYKCSGDTDIDRTKWVKLKTENRIENKIDPVPLYMLDPACMCWRVKKTERI